MARFGIVVSRFNHEVTDRLLKSCLGVLGAHGVKKGDAWVVRVPGAFEIPWTAQELALTRRFDVLICLGAVIQGRTRHDFHVADAVAKALAEISLKTRVPCVFGVLTPKSEAQALARTKGRMDRGREAALTALEMAGLRRLAARGQLSG